MNVILEVFWRFLVLGCFSFGGPAAHLGYFRNTFVEKLKWVDDTQYGQMIALSQFLPGPGSSQVGFSIGYHRAGLLGALAAFLGFTLPSFLLMFALAFFSQSLSEFSFLEGIIHGLKLLAVVVVVDAISGMFRSFCTSTVTIGIAVLSAVSLWFFPFVLTQLFLLALAAMFGLMMLGDKNSLQASKSSSSLTQRLRMNYFTLSLFILLLVGTPILLESGIIGSQSLVLFSEFYQAGSFVFGGGHVVLPLLERLLGDAISTDMFLLGYSAAQGVPGPMFSLATFLGAELLGSGESSVMLSFWGALIATIAIFLPGFLLILSFQNIWAQLSSQIRFQGMIKAINACVVGLLIAALYQPVFFHAVGRAEDMACVLIGLFLLRYLKVPIVFMVIGFALLGFGVSEYYKF